MTPKEIRREQNFRLLVLIATLGGTFALTLLIDQFLLAVILAIVIFHLLKPACDFLERKGFTKKWAALAPFLILSGLLVLATVQLLPLLRRQFIVLNEKLPQYLESSRQALQNLESRLADYSIYVDLELIIAALPQKLSGWSTQWIQNIPGLISGSFTLLFLTPFLAFFMLADGRKFLRGLYSLVPNQYLEVFVHLSGQINYQIGTFIRARLVEAFFVGLAIWIGLIIIEFPYALLLGFVGGLLNIIPYLGPVLGALPAIFLAIADPSNLHLSENLIPVIAVYAVAQLFDNVVLVPFLVARIVNLHPILVVLSVLLGAHLLGVVGMIISIPVVGALKVCFSVLYDHILKVRNPS
jgi:putative permease